MGDAIRSAILLGVVIVLASALSAAAVSAEEAPRAKPVYGPWEEFHAVYSVAPVPYGPGRRIQAVTLVKPSGEVYLRSPRPIPTEYKYIGQTVYVEGRRRLSSGERFGGVGVPFAVETLRAVSSGRGASANPGLRAPPISDSMKTVRPRVGLWSMLEGVLESVDRRTDPAVGVLRLRWGGHITLFGINRADVDRFWSPLLGEDVTVVGLINQADGTPVVIKATGVCQGRAPRCGMLPGAPQGARSVTTPKGPRRPSGPLSRPQAPRRPSGVKMRAPRRPSPYPR